MEKKKIGKRIGEEIIVFLDEDMPFHPDYIFLNKTPPVKAESCESINKYLKKFRSGEKGCNYSITSKS